MNRAYSLLNVKAVSETADAWVIEGIASTPRADRMKDIVEPLGAKFALPMPLLWQHQASMPVGLVTFSRPNKDGIPYRAELPKVKEAGTLKDRIDEAVQSIKYRLVAAVSIGFNAVEGAYEHMKNGGIRFKEWEWLELSLVTIPANADATITSIKSIDDALRAATGPTQGGSGRRPPPGASGIHQQPASSGLSFARSLKGTQVKTIQAMREERTQKAARMSELADLFQAAGHDSTDDEAAEFDTLTDEVKALDNEIRVAQFHAINAAGAKGVDGSSAAAASRSRGPTIIVRSGDADEAFKGQNFTRMVIAKAVAHLQQSTPSAIAIERWGKSNPTLARLIKANEVAGGGSGSGEWGAELVSADNRYTGDFIEFMHAMTVYDRLPLREVPANISIKGSDGAATGFWVGESRAVPVTAMSAITVALTPLKVASLAVVSNELLRDSQPSAERWVRDMLAKAISQRVDATFLSATAASAGVSPAGLLNGLSAGASAGNDADAVRQDIAALMAGFITANDTEDLHFVSTPALGLQLELMRNALGQREFDGIGMGGGTLAGRPFITGGNVGAGDLLLLKPSDIWRIGDRGIEVSISREAMIEQNSVPTGATDTPTGAATAFTSMFQSNSTAIMVSRSINFAKRHSYAVAYIGDADYGATSGA